MPNFEDRLSKAIKRGTRRGDTHAREEAEKAIGEQELRQLHTKYRLSLSEHIEHCLKNLPQHFPGFRFEPIVNEKGWGAGVSRDDLNIGTDRRRTNLFSRLEMLIRPVSKYFVLELTAKATVQNKEIFNRNHFQRLAEVDPTSFTELIDIWTLEFAELYAAKK